MGEKVATCLIKFFTPVIELASSLLEMSYMPLVRYPRPQDESRPPGSFDIDSKERAFLASTLERVIKVYTSLLLTVEGILNEGYEPIGDEVGVWDRLALIAFDLLCGGHFGEDTKLHVYAACSCLERMAANGMPLTDGLIAQLRDGLKLLGPDPTVGWSAPSPAGESWQAELSNAFSRVFFNMNE